MSVIHLWAGATTESSFWVRGKITGSNVRLVVSEDISLTNPTFFGPESPTTEDIVSIEATGLDPNTQYHYAFEVDSTIDSDWQGKIRTFPVTGQPASFSFGAWSCAGGGSSDWITSSVSNHPAHDDVRNHDLLFLVHMGDLHYRDIETNTPSLFRDAFDDVLTFNGVEGADAKQGLLYRSTSLAYIWDDHDYGAGSSAGHKNNPAKPAAQQVYRERVPHYDLPSNQGAIFQSFVVGRVRVVMLDVRSERDPHNGLDNDDPNKDHLGAEQKTWLFDILENAEEELIILTTVVPWIASDSSPFGLSDSWGNFIVSRDEITQKILEEDWQEKIVAVSGDMHALAFDDGINNQWGGFPVLQFGSMDSSASTKGGPYSHGPNSGRGRYGLVNIDDDGQRIRVTATGYVDNSVWQSLEFRVPKPFVLETPVSRIGNDIVSPSVWSGEEWRATTTRIARG